MRSQNPRNIGASQFPVSATAVPIQQTVIEQHIPASFKWSGA